MAMIRPHSYLRMVTCCPQQASGKYYHYHYQWPAVWHAGNKAQHLGRRCCWEMPGADSVQPVYICTLLSPLIIPKHIHLCYILITIYKLEIALLWSPLPPVGHIWDVMLVWRKGNINKNCLCVTVLCTIIMVHKDTSSTYRLVDCIRLWSCLV